MCIESRGNSIKNEFREGQRGSGSGLSGRFQWVEPKVAWPLWLGYKLVVGGGT